MYEIDRKYLREDGSLDLDATDAACRKARAQAAGEGFGFVARVVRRAVAAGVRVAGGLRERIFHARRDRAA